MMFDRAQRSFFSMTLLFAVELSITKCVAGFLLTEHHRYNATSRSGRFPRVSVNRGGAARFSFESGPHDIDAYHDVLHIFAGFAGAVAELSAHQRHHIVGK